MLLRATTAAIILFWAVMSGLLLRDTYFPDHSRFAEVPPRLVFDLFLADATAFNNTLHLYKDGARLGHATFTARRADAQDASPAYSLSITGAVELRELPRHEDGRPAEASFRLRGDLADAEQWSGLDLEVRVPSQEIFAHLAWREQAEFPDVEVRRGAELLMNTEILRSMLAISGAGGLPGLFGKMPGLPARQGAAAPALTAREGVMDLAGKRRKCRILTADLLGVEQVRAWFTESGALARVDLPQGYQLLEPLMHGLDLDPR